MVRMVRFVLASCGGMPFSEVVRVTRKQGGVKEIFFQDMGHFFCFNIRKRCGWRIFRREIRAPEYEILARFAHLVGFLCFA